MRCTKRQRLAHTCKPPTRPQRRKQQQLATLGRRMRLMNQARRDWQSASGRSQVSNISTQQSAPEKPNHQKDSTTKVAAPLRCGVAAKAGVARGSTHCAGQRSGSCVAAPNLALPPQMTLDAPNHVLPPQMTPGPANMQRFMHPITLLVQVQQCNQPTRSNGSNKACRTTTASPAALTQSQQYEY